MNKSGKTLVLVIVFVAIAFAAFFVGRHFWKSDGGATSQPVANEPDSQQPSSETGNNNVADGPQTPIPQSAASQSAVKEVSSDEASRLFNDGMALYKTGAVDKYIAARRALSDAMNSGKLDSARLQDAMKTLTDLANKTIFSNVAHEGDPYTYLYTIKPGQVLQNVEREEKLHVPQEGILMINGIASGKDIKAGQRVKLLRGPFHAVVYRSQCVMDIYLQDTFVRRIKVCVGAPESPTPTGYFRLTLSGKEGTGKLRNAPYNPPASFRGSRGKLMPGDPGYPLDPGGHWIGLMGRADMGTNVSSSEGYGIHGTNDPASIGTAASHGCVRLSDEDIKFVFNTLYEYWSTVTILP